MEFVCKNQKENSIMLLSEESRSVHEYAENKIIISLYPTDLLIVHNWVAVRRIIDTNPGNSQKFWIQQMPIFNEDTFPFLVCSGKETLNLINVKDFHLEPLIQAPVNTDGPQ